MFWKTLLGNIVIKGRSEVILTHISLDNLQVDVKGMAIGSKAKSFVRLPAKDLDLALD